MNQLADDVFVLRGFPPNIFNIYLIGGVLIDSGTRFASRRILTQLQGRAVSAHALTHAHPDHQGSSHAVCQALGVPLWCGAADADAVEDPTLIEARMPNLWLVRRLSRPLTGPGHQVARQLREGDEVGGFVALETPGHTAGHLSFWRESDRTLVAGDVLANFHAITLGPKLREPPRCFSADPGLNRRSARRLAALEPALICFGHGPPSRDTRKFVDFVASLPV
jgi:glyoxylase-like metal-dependent hydrolase (beta-lactamase superfamily II)